MSSACNASWKLVAPGSRKRASAMGVAEEHSPSVAPERAVRAPRETRNGTARHRLSAARVGAAPLRKRRGCRGRRRPGRSLPRRPAQRGRLQRRGHAGQARVRRGHGRAAAARVRRRPRRGAFLETALAWRAIPVRLLDVVRTSGRSLLHPHLSPHLGGVGVVGAVLKETPTIVTPRPAAWPGCSSWTRSRPSTTPWPRCVNTIVVTIHQGGFQNPSHANPTDRHPRWVSRFDPSSSLWTAR